MSKSLRRVESALRDAGLPARVQEMPATTRTAPEAATAAGCALDQIVKSIVFQGAKTGHLILFLTAGGNRICPEKAAALAAEPLGRADPLQVRAETGFAIGGVAPLGHLAPLRTFADPRLLDFDTVWAAAGTPRHVFAAGPAALIAAAGAELADFTLPDAAPG